MFTKNCCICFQEVDPSDLFPANSLVWENYNMKELIEKHLCVIIDKNVHVNSGLCCECWRLLSGFHNFYKRVHQAHSALNQQNETKEKNFLLKKNSEELPLPLNKGNQKPNNEESTNVNNNVEEIPGFAHEPYSSIDDEHLYLEPFASNFEIQIPGMVNELYTSLDEDDEYLKENYQKIDFVGNKVYNNAHNLKREILQSDNCNENITNSVHLVKSLDKDLNKEQKTEVLKDDIRSEKSNILQVGKKRSFTNLKSPTKLQEISPTVQKLNKPLSKSTNLRSRKSPNKNIRKKEKCLPSELKKKNILMEEEMNKNVDLNSSNKKTSNERIVEIQSAIEINNLTLNKGEHKEQLKVQEAKENKVVGRESKLNNNKMLAKKINQDNVVKNVKKRKNNVEVADSQSENKPNLPKIPKTSSRKKVKALKLNKENDLDKENIKPENAGNSNCLNKNNKTTKYTKKNKSEVINKNFQSNQKEAPETHVVYCGEVIDKSILPDENTLTNLNHGQLKGLQCVNSNDSKETLTTWTRKQKIGQVNKIDFKCDDCLKSFKSKNLLDDHIRKVHQSIYIKICPICGDVFRSIEAFNSHMYYHQNNSMPLIKCEFCGTLLTGPMELYRHQLLHHPQNGIQEYRCSDCSFSSPNAKELKCHTQYVHKKKTTHLCRICDKRFKRYQALVNHMITHTGDTLYGCLHCHKTGNSDYNMNVHCKNAHPQEWAEEQRNKIELKDNPQAIDFDMSTDTSVSSIEQKDNIMKPSVILSKVPKTTKTRKRKTQKLKDINNPNKKKTKYRPRKK